MAPPEGAGGRGQAAGEARRTGKDQDEEEEAVHIGDIVLLKCQLQDELYAEGNDAYDDGTGYVRAVGVRSSVTVVPMSALKMELGLDIRELLFVVVDQLKYNAQKDLRRFRKLVALGAADGAGVSGGQAASASQAHLRTLEERADLEADQNQEILRNKKSPVCYGEIIQLQHVKTGRFLSVKAQSTADLNGTARKLVLEEGNARCWLRVNPLFSHKMQGEPVRLIEQVTMESTKLGNGWNLNWSKCKTAAEQTVYEVNCLKRGRGFYIMPYCRARASLPLVRDASAAAEGPPLAFGTAIRLFHAHLDSFATGDSASATVKVKTEDSTTNLDAGLAPHSRVSVPRAEDVWIIERAEPFSRGLGSLRTAWEAIAYSVTPVLLRHHASGKYLAVAGESLVSRGLVGAPVEDNLGDQEDLPSPASSTNGRARNAANFSVGCVNATLQETPGWNSTFLLEFAGSVAMTKGTKTFLPTPSACAMISWTNGQSIDPVTLWLSSPVASPGASVDLQWTQTKYSRDAFWIDVVDSSWMNDCDVVHEHLMIMKRDLWPLMRRMNREAVAMLVCQQAIEAFGDMILFLSGTERWRPGIRTLTEKAKPREALKVAWHAREDRQAIVREMGYIDSTVQFFKAFAAHSEQLGGKIDAAARVGALSVGLDTQKGGGESAELVMAKVLCSKLMVRMWLYTLADCQDTGNYFQKKGWIEVVDGLNGRGVGASDVLVTLLRGNAELARHIDQNAIRKVIDFIAILGPLSTWFAFLQALCVPGDVVVSRQQQQVLEKLIYAGPRAFAADTQAAEETRKQFCVAVQLGEPIGTPLGPPWRAGQEPRPDQYLGRDIVTLGIHDVAIAWRHPESWRVGQCALFHGPKALGLDVLSNSGGHLWVSLAHIAWVLHPKRCCPATFSMSEEELLEREIPLHPNAPRSKKKGDAFDRGGDSSGGGVPFALESCTRVELLTTLTNYFLNQLKLMSCLCRERQMNCVMTLQNYYPFSLCVSGAGDLRLPSAMRAAFTNLLVDLWLDRHPHCELIVPLLVHGLERDEENIRVPTFSGIGLETPDSWSEAHRKRLPDHVEEFYRITGAEKMHGLIQLVRRHLCAGPIVEQQVHSQKDDTVLMAAVLRVVNFLLRFGFLSTVEAIQELLGPLMRCLDGRTDWLTEPPDLEESSTPDAPFGAAPSSGGTREAAAPLLEGADTSTRLNGNVKRLPMARFPPFVGQAERYENTDWNEPIMKSKVQIVQILLHIMKMGAHVRISKIVKAFASYALPLQTQGPPPQELIEEILTILNTPVFPREQIGVCAPKVMMLDLACYEDPTLRALALEALTATCLRTADLLDHLHHVTILSSTRSTELFNRIRDDAATLERLVYSFETWGIDDDCFTERNDGPYMELQCLCMKLRSLCKLGDGPTTAREVQNMLQLTGFADLVRYAVRVHLEDSNAQGQAMLQLITTQMCSTAMQFVRGNPRNQGILFDVVASAAELMGTMPACALLICEIYRDNGDLCESVPEPLVMKFGELAARERQRGRFVPWYLEFFNVILTAGPRCLAQNQVYVIKALKRYGPQTILHIINRYEADLKRLQLLAQNFRSMEQLRDIDMGQMHDPDGELLYYIASLRLLERIAECRGSQSHLNRPFVLALVTRRTLLQMLLVIDVGNQPMTDAQDKRCAILRVVRARWLHLVNALVYNVEVGAIDLEFLLSPMHLGFLQGLLLWAKDICRLSAFTSPLRWEATLLCETDELYAAAILTCIGTFFGSPCTRLRQGDANAGEDFDAIVEDYAVAFAPVLAGDSSLTAQVGLNDPSRLMTAARRINNSICQGSSSLPSSAPSVTETTQTHSRRQTQWQSMLDALVADPRVEAALKRDEEELGAVFSCLGELTDPERSEYVQHLPDDPRASLPDGVDFRRGAITTVELLKKLTRHCRGHMYDEGPLGLATIRRVLKCLAAMLNRAKASSDLTILATVQGQFVAAGVMPLLVKSLGSQLSEDITDKCWALLAGALERKDGTVNTIVQQGLYDACTAGECEDDSGMWTSFNDSVEEVNLKLKPMRDLKRLGAKDLEESKEMKEYEESIGDVVEAMNAVRLMVEGHFFPMQQYVFSQEGNSGSCNVVAVSAEMVIRLCKDDDAVDLADEVEISCVQAALSLLIELSQGPNVRNQEFLSTIGLVETTFKLLGANFDRLRVVSDDLYPESVRRVKASFIQTLLSLLEGRTDVKNHLTLLQRLDEMECQHRIEFVYRYFVFGAVAVSLGEVRSSEASAYLPVEGRWRWLLGPTADPTDVYSALSEAAPIADELIEDFDDAELGLLLGEGLNLMQLVFELSHHSRDFESQVCVPLNAEVLLEPHAKAFSTNTDYMRALVAYRSKSNYRRAYLFLQRFVKTIEVIIGGHLQKLHFHQPLTAMWYVHGAMKHAILEKVPLSAPDLKAKAFVEMCLETHRESKLIRELSRFRLAGFLPKMGE
eukprot:TRINITY_DN20903_c0_g2_i2.p1 TRINITY_DN20903_c0_g2~~TRINITY_DN20903_c0_g2_i2.p1  ORF type:complete len:2449 (-),score=481.36 TRINITY_DN20903_c0_g2_i2:1420-8766(-)